MGLAIGVVVTLAVMVLIAVPSARLGRRLGTPKHIREASAEEQAQWKRERAARRKAAVAAMTRRERILLYGYSALTLPALPVGILLTVYGHGTARTVGIAALIASLVLTAVPVGPILGDRARRRRRAADDS